jgi:chemotaxis protein MotA
MLVILGAIVVLGSVLAGFSMAGGHVGALIHPSEFVTIGGATLGGFMISAPKRVLIDVFKGVISGLKGSPFNKAAYMDLFKMYYMIARTVRRDGLLALDSHLSDPHESAIFNKFPRLSKNHHLMHFLTSALSLVTEGKTDPEYLRSQLDTEIGVFETEHHEAVLALSKTADALPGFGIVAAVLGIVVTMGAINGPVEEIGHKVGAALVGTFLGILASYGFLAPFASRMELQGHSESAFFKTAAAMTIAMIEGGGPRDVISQACRGVGSEFRPSREDLESIYKEGDAG